MSCAQHFVLYWQKEKKKELCFPLSHSSVLQLTSHVVYQDSPHLTACTSHYTLAQAYTAGKPAGHPTHMTHPLEPLNCHMCHYPNAESQPHSSLPNSISALFQNSVQHSHPSGNQSARFVEHSQIQRVEERGLGHALKKT